jgi:hypothetical protein
MGYLNDNLRNEPRFWFLKKAYQKLQPPYNKHFAAVVASESGGGKSYTTMTCAEAMYPDFDPNESIAFDARQFLKISEGDHPMGFPIILDDAGLSAYSGDALSKEVGAISKIAQSIRYKNWQVYLNLPSLDLLAKSVRITNHYYIEPVWIDMDSEECFCKFQRMSINPKGGDKLKFSSPRTWITRTNEVTGFEEVKRCVHHTIPIPHPNKVKAKIYEKLKDENLSKFREDTRLMLEKRHAEKIKSKPRIIDIMNLIKEHPENFTRNGKLSPATVADKFHISPSSAYSILKGVKEIVSEQVGSEVKET